MYWSMKLMKDLEKSANFITKQRGKNSWSPWDLPDIVLGYQDGLIYHAPEASICSIAPLFKENSFTSGEGYILFHEGTNTLIIFLVLLYSFASSIPHVGAPILKDYLLPITTSGEMKIPGINI